MSFFVPWRWTARKHPRPSNPLTSTRTYRRRADSTSYGSGIPRKGQRTGIEGRHNRAAQGPDPSPQHHGSRFPRSKRIRYTDPKRTLRASDVPRRCRGDPPRPTTLPALSGPKIWANIRRVARMPSAHSRHTDAPEQLKSIQVLVLGPLPPPQLLADGPGWSVTSSSVWKWLVLYQQRRRCISTFQTHL